MHAVMKVDVSRFGASEYMEVFSCRVAFMLLIQATTRYEHSEVKNVLI